ncbi:helix-turn-helix domain-containing protein [Bacillus sp. EE-W1]|uniref:helix-turn-helix domain-containing protein n=1 Tax=Bacillus sp. EE-W1 TaxID=2662453 RepID=UPI0012FA95B3|nr:helix-turn-helix domain-containing protein [Bacillus sp. EE-W1]
MCLLNFRRCFVLVGKQDEATFIKISTDAIESGIVSDLGDERWQTLCVLVSFMNNVGECYTSQDVIADSLDVSRESANKRIKKLCEYRWDGEPLIVKETNVLNGKQFSTNRYSLSISNLFELPYDNEFAITQPNKPHNGQLSDVERVSRRLISGYGNWVESVKKRDNYMCTVCGNSKNVVAHHLNSYDLFEEERTDLENGLTLCDKCHLNFHSEYGFGNNTKQQFDEWRKRVEVRGS